MLRRLCFVALTIAVASASACPSPMEVIDVNVVGILASEHNKVIDPKLTEFAKQVQTKQPSLVGFQFGRTNSETLKLGETKKFTLAGNEVVEVTVNKERNEKGRITLTIKPPKMEAITYECVCDKYFSMATDHYEGKDKDRTRLFVAIMAKPCAAPKK